MEPYTAINLEMSKYKKLQEILCDSLDFLNDVSTVKSKPHDR